MCDSSTVKVLPNLTLVKCSFNGLSEPENIIARLATKLPQLKTLYMDSCGRGSSSEKPLPEWSPSSFIHLTDLCLASMTITSESCALSFSNLASLAKLSISSHCYVNQEPTHDFSRSLGHALSQTPLHSLELQCPRELLRCVLTLLDDDHHHLLVWLKIQAYPLRITAPQSDSHLLNTLVDRCANLGEFKPKSYYIVDAQARSVHTNGQVHPINVLL